MKIYYFKNIYCFIFLSFSSFFCLAQEMEKDTFFTNSKNEFFIKKSTPIELKVMRANKEKVLSSNNQESIGFQQEGVYHIEIKNPKGEKIKSFPVTVDNTPPSTSIKFKFDNKAIIDKKTYYNKPLQIEFFSKDKLSGVNNIFYKVNQDTQYTPYQGTDTFEKENEYQINYYAEDQVGNREKNKSSTFFLDDTAPTTQLIVEGDTVGNIVSPQTVFKINSTDDHPTASGVKQSFIQFNEEKTISVNDSSYSVKALSDGNHSVYFYSVDQVENQEEKRKYDFYVDKIPPICGYVLEGTQFRGKKLYVRRNTKLILYATDNKSGTKNIFYQLGNKNFLTYGDTVHLPDDGNGILNISFYAEDKVKNSNKAQPSSIQVFIDETAPVIDYSYTKDIFQTKDTVLISSQNSIVLTAKDQDSGLQKINYQINDSSFFEYKEPINISEEGTYSINIKSSDQLNNTASKTISFYVDNTPPELNFTFSTQPLSSEGQDSVDYVLPNYVKIYLSATDNKTDVANIFYTINDGEEQLYNKPLENLPQDEILDIEFKTIDKLNNYNAKKLKILLLKN